MHSARIISNRFVAEKDDVPVVLHDSISIRSPDVAKKFPAAARRRESNALDLTLAE